jgi:hypothetical protein
MPSSGTYTFSLSRDDLINAALRVTTAYGPLDTVPPADIVYCAQALNILVKSVAFRGLPLWCVVTQAIPLVAGQAAYNLSTAFNMPRPQKVLNAWIRTPAAQDTILNVTSRQEYEQLGIKNSQGIPNQAYYDPQLGAAMFTLYNVPQDATNTLYVTIQRQIQDFNLATDNPDFPQEAYQLLKWCLADEISLEYSTPADIRKEITEKAVAFLAAFMDAEQEYASVTFTPGSQLHGAR